MLVLAFRLLEQALAVLDPVDGLEDETVAVDHLDLWVVHERLIGQPLEGEEESVGVTIEDKKGRNAHSSHSIRCPVDSSRLGSLR